MSAKPPLTLKVVLLGDSAVGKTSLLNKLSDGFGSPMADTPSLGVDVKKRTFHIDGRTVKLQVWDTAGQERFKSITRSFYRDAHGVALCYDITRRDSFHGVKKWLTEIAEESPDCELMLIGNKTDIADETPSAREVPTAAGVALAKELRIPFFETSAKTGANIEKSFECLSARGLARATGKPMPLLPDESPVASIATAAAPSTGGGPAVVGGPSSTLATAGAGTSSTSGASSVGAFGAASPAAWRHKSKDIDVVRIEAEAHTVAVTGGASSRGRCSC